MGDGLNEHGRKRVEELFAKCGGLRDDLEAMTARAHAAEARVQAELARVLAEQETGK